MTATTTKKTIITRAHIGMKLDQLRGARIALGALHVSRDKAVAIVADKFKTSIEDQTVSISELESEIKQWAIDNRAAEFGDEKTLAFPSGATLQFKTGSKSVVYLAGKDETKVLAALEKRKLPQFIRVTKAINKQGLISAWGTKLLPASVAKAIGIKVEQGEAVNIYVPMATAGKEQA